MRQRSRDVVYIVDADASVRQGLARLVDSAGLEAKPCDSTAAFLHQGPTGRGACALLDISALLLCEPDQWAKLRALAQSLPIIALSADDDPATRRMARAMGARAFFRKPVDAAALLDSIDWVMHTEGRA
jgi:two-component system, LuxR family, response regulator FixJ